MTAVLEEARPRKASFRARLGAWWKGKAPVRIPPKTKAPPWTADRIQMAERLWGAGLHTPGGEAHVEILVRPFGLNPQMTVLDLGAGLGGCGRVMAKNYGCRVTGMEQWPILAEAGMERSRLAGMDKKAPVELYDPATIRLKPGGYNCVFAKEAFFTIADKARLFGEISNTLRPGGQLCFTDYVMPEDLMATPAVDVWMKSEPLAPFPCSSRDTLDLLAHNQLELRVAEDVTDMHQALILQGWRDLTQALAPGSIAPETLPRLVHEAELWTRRGDVLRTGDIRVYRFYAIKAG